MAVGAKLWIVQPAGFDLSEKRVRRAGLDYWKDLDLESVDGWPSIKDWISAERTFYFSRFATQTIWDAKFCSGDVLVFGSESSGLPPEIMSPSDDHAIRIPTSGPVRSLNLATTVGIVLFEQQRQLRLLGQ